MDGDSCVLIWVSSALSGYDNVLAFHREAGVNVAVLEHHSRVSQNKVYSSVDVALSIKLSKRVRVESVLIPFEYATVERRHVGTHSQCHGLEFVGSGCVGDRQVHPEKPCSLHNCEQ